MDRQLQVIRRDASLDGRRSVYVCKQSYRTTAISGRTVLKVAKRFDSNKVHPTARTLRHSECNKYVLGSRGGKKSKPSAAFKIMRRL